MARYLGTALYWIAASINIKPGHDYYFYIRIFSGQLSVRCQGKCRWISTAGNG
ncbi:phage tail tip protein J-related protein, partial [Bacillus sp. HC-TM]